MHVADVARVTDGAGEPGDYVMHYPRGGHAFPAVTLSVAKRKGTNAIALTRAVERKVETTRGYLLPRDLNVSVTRDYGETAAQKSNELLWHMFLAIVSVSALIWLVLGRRESAVVHTAIPVTLALTPVCVLSLCATRRRHREDASVRQQERTAGDRPHAGGHTPRDHRRRRRRAHRSRAARRRGRERPSYAGTSSPYTFNGLVRHYFLRQRPNLADLQIVLVGKEERSDQSHAIAKRLRTRLDSVASGLDAHIQVVEVPPGPAVLQTLVAEVYGPDAGRRLERARTVLSTFEHTPGVVDADIVILEAVVDAEGVVKEVRVLRSANPLLDLEALAAVRQWRYSPVVLNGTAGIGAKRPCDLDVARVAKGHKLLGRQAAKRDIGEPWLRDGAHDNLTPRIFGQHAPAERRHFGDQPLGMPDAGLRTQRQLTRSKDGANHRGLLEIYFRCRGKRDLRRCLDAHVVSLRHVVGGHDAIQQRIGFVAARRLGVAVS